MGDRRCDDALRSLYPYLDGEVTWYRKIRIRRHLRSCNGCGPAFSFEGRFLEVVKDRLDEPPPTEMIDRLHQVLREQNPEEPST